MEIRIHDRYNNYGAREDGHVINMTTGKVVRTRSKDKRKGETVRLNFHSISLKRFLCHAWHGESYGRNVEFIDGDNHNFKVLNLRWNGDAILLPIDAVIIPYDVIDYWATPNGYIWSTRNIGDGYARKLLGTQNSNGYLSVRINGKLKPIHIIICNTFHGSKTVTNNQVRHLNDEKLDNSASNLMWGTPKQNSEDKIRNGHAPDLKGVKHGRSKLDDDKVRQIRVKINEGIQFKDIAIEFNIDSSAISRIYRGLNWQHVI